MMHQELREAEHQIAELASWVCVCVTRIHLSCEQLAMYARS